jgi:hypothetical protein
MEELGFNCPMKRSLLIAGVLSAIAALVHGIAGEMTTIQSLLSTNIEAVPATELRAVWHMVTIHLSASAVMLFILAKSANKTLGRFLAVQFAGYGMVFLAVAVIHQVGLLETPQWILLFPIAGLTYWGSR